MAVPRMSNLIASRNWSQALTASRQSSNKDDRSPKVDVKVSITFPVLTYLTFIRRIYRGCRIADAVGCFFKLMCDSKVVVFEADLYIPMLYVS